VKEINFLEKAEHLKKVKQFMKHDDDLAVKK